MAERERRTESSTDREIVHVVWWVMLMCINTGRVIRIECAADSVRGVWVESRQGKWTWRLLLHSIVKNRVKDDQGWAWTSDDDPM